jgi:hypothetical protein
MCIKVAAFSLVIICVFAISRCSDNTLAPFQPEVTSATDNFQLQATGVKNRSATLNYSWDNTGTRAKINHSTTTSFGTARLIITDTGGAPVYEKTLAPSLTDTTTTGTAGTWTIRLVLNNYSGTLNFRVQKL